MSFFNCKILALWKTERTEAILWPLQPLAPTLSPHFRIDYNSRLWAVNASIPRGMKGFFILLLKKWSISRNGQLSGTPRVSPWGRSAIASRPDRRKSNEDDGLTLHVLDPNFWVLQSWKLMETEESHLIIPSKKMHCFSKSDNPATWPSACRKKHVNTKGAMESTRQKTYSITSFLMQQVDRSSSVEEIASHGMLYPLDTWPLPAYKKPITEDSSNHVLATMTSFFLFMPVAWAQSAMSVTPGLFLRP